MDALSRTELDAHDARPQIRGREHRYLCPLSACADKQAGGQHRSMAVNTETGVYYCHRCQAKGKLREFWTTAPTGGDRGRTNRSRTRSAFALEEKPKSDTPPLENADKIGVPILEDGAGLAYLAGRGIPAEVAGAAGCRFDPEWRGSDEGKGAPAVVFPLHDEDGAYIAAQGRYITDRIPKCVTRGPKSQAIFETLGALQAETFVITEAPIDALSLAVCGIPAIALCGTSAPSWLYRHVFNRRVWVGTDADVAGDEAAVKLEGELRSRGALVKRVRPLERHKDWNGMLTAFGATMLRYMALPDDFTVDDLEHLGDGSWLRGPAPISGREPDGDWYRERPAHIQDPVMWLVILAEARGARIRIHGGHLVVLQPADGLPAGMAEALMARQREVVERCRPRTATQEEMAEVQWQTL